MMVVPHRKHKPLLPIKGLASGCVIYLCGFRRSINALFALKVFPLPVFLNTLRSFLFREQNVSGLSILFCHFFCELLAVKFRFMLYVAGNGRSSLFCWGPEGLVFAAASNCVRAHLGRQFTADLKAPIADIREPQRRELLIALTGLAAPQKQCMQLTYRLQQLTPLYIHRQRITAPYSALKHRLVCNDQKIWKHF
jgi:hypothetical protein